MPEEESKRRKIFLPEPPEKPEKRSKFPLYEEEIREANAQTASVRQAAKYLDVSRKTYKRYAELYGLYDEQKATGNPKFIRYYVGTDVSLKEILKGNCPGYSPVKLKRRLLGAGLKKPECEVCGFNEKRVTDGEVPLYLNHKNGNQEDHREENLEMLCWNCTFSSVGSHVLKNHRDRMLMLP